MSGKGGKKAAEKAPAAAAPAPAAAAAAAGPAHAHGTEKRAEKAEKRRELVVVDAEGNKATPPSRAKLDEVIRQIDAQAHEQTALRTSKPPSEGEIVRSYKTKETDLNSRLTANRKEQERIRQQLAAHNRGKESKAAAAASSSSSSSAPATKLSATELTAQIQALEKKLASTSLTLLERTKALNEVQHVKQALTLASKSEAAAAAAASSAAAAAAAAAASAAAASAPAELTPKDLDALERKLVGLESAAKDLQNQLASLTKEKDAEIAKAKEARERVSQIGGELSKLRAQKTELEAEFNKAHEAYQTLVKIARRKQEEQSKAEAAAALKEARRAERMIPQFVAEIDSLTNLISFLVDSYAPECASAEDVSTDKASSSSSSNIPSLAKAPTRALEGGRPNEVLLETKTSKSDESVFFQNSANKALVAKHKEKDERTTSAPSKLAFSLDALSAFYKFNVDVPTSFSEVPDAIAKLRASKATFVKRQQDELAKAKKEEEEEERLAALAAASAPAAASN